MTKLQELICLQNKTFSRKKNAEILTLLFLISKNQKYLPPDDYKNLPFDQLQLLCKNDDLKIDKNVNEIVIRTR